MIKKIIINFLFSFLLVSFFNQFLMASNEEKKEKLRQHRSLDSDSDDEYKDCRDDFPEKPHSTLHTPTTTKSPLAIASTSQTPSSLGKIRKNTQAKTNIPYLRKYDPSTLSSPTSDVASENSTKQYIIPSRFYIPDIPHQSINDTVENPNSFVHFRKMKDNAYIQIKIENTNDNNAYVPAKEWFTKSQSTDLGDFIQHSKSNIYASNGNDTLFKIKNNGMDTIKNRSYWSIFKYTLLNPRASISNSWYAIRNYFGGIWGLTKVYGG